jgi:hypothetical protein
MKKIVLFITLLLLMMSWNLFAQEDAEEPVVLLMYFQDVEIVNPDEEILYEEDLEEEMKISVGSTILTGATGAVELEIRYPDYPEEGTVIKLSEETTFTIETIAGINSPDLNSYNIESGKFRSIVAAISGQRTEAGSGNSVCGVRGTDYGVHVDPGLGIDDAFVLDGLIDYSKKNSDGSRQTIALGGGQMASAMSDVFQPVPIPPAQLALLQETMGFEKLKEKAEKLKEKRKEPTPEPTEEPTPEPEPTIEPSTEPEPTEVPLPLPEDDPLMKWLKDVLGMEIGSITIGDETYAKAVMQPTFEIGKLKTALYLPIIYKNDMFNPDDWYHPKGNDEWSFGTDQAEDDYMAIGEDFLSDLFLKIKYLQWGDNRDDFFFKVGNLNNFTIGHGLIMNNYANDTDFPAIRRIGVNFGLDLEKWGFELMTNDLADIEILGTRVYFRPVGKLAIGVSAVTDIAPAAELPETYDPANGVPTAEMIGNPIFLNAGLDLDLPIVESDFFSAVLFADIAGMLPYFQADATDYNISAGLAHQAMFTPDSGLKNYGANAGIFGNVWMIDYNLHARYFTGTFRSGFYGTNYDRIRGELATDAAVYIDALAAGGAALDPYDNLDMGIYGQAGYTLPKVFSLDIGYMWPFAIDENGELAPAADDEIHLKAVLEKGVIPGIDVSGSLTYDRTNFAPMLAQKILGEDPEAGDKPYDWIDEYTVLKGEVIYGVSPNLDLAAILSGTVVRDEETGNIVYDSNGNQETNISFSIETRVHF